jgi:hypothetical protein
LITDIYYTFDYKYNKNFIYKLKKGNIRTIEFARMVLQSSGLEHVEMEFLRQFEKRIIENGIKILVFLNQEENDKLFLSSCN